MNDCRIDSLNINVIRPHRDRPFILAMHDFAENEVSFRKVACGPDRTALATQHLGAFISSESDRLYE